MSPVGRGRSLVFANLTDASLWGSSVTKVGPEDWHAALSGRSLCMRLMLLIEA